MLFDNFILLAECQSHPRLTFGHLQIGCKEDTFGWLEKVFDQVTKGTRWMPWHGKAMKDVVSCDKLRLGANNLLGGDFRMG